MSAEDTRRMLEEHWRAAGVDEERSNAVYADDAVLEFPQSGERFRGRANILAWRSLYPASLTIEIRRLRGDGELWVAENSITYGGDDTWLTVSILEIRDGRIAREAIYFSKPFPAPDWRAPWVDPEPVAGR